MKLLIKKFLLIFILLYTSAFLFADEQHSPLIDLSITVISLDNAVKTGQDIPEEGTPLILNGTVIERNLVNPEKEDFSAELILADGEWVSSDDIAISKCLVVLNGPEFHGTIPARRSRKANPKEISLNSEILVYAVYMGIVRTQEGPMAVLQAYGVRKL